MHLSSQTPCVNFKIICTMQIHLLFQACPSTEAWRFQDHCQHSAEERCFRSTTTYRHKIKKPVLLRTVGKKCIINQQPDLNNENASYLDELLLGDSQSNSFLLHMPTSALFRWRAWAHLELWVHTGLLSRCRGSMWLCWSGREASLLRFLPLTEEAEGASSAY